jgi:hypothetical protein
MEGEEGKGEKGDGGDEEMVDVERKKGEKTGRRTGNLSNCVESRDWPISVAATPGFTAR